MGCNCGQKPKEERTSLGRARLEICESCDHLNGVPGQLTKRCAICGCFVEVKARVPGMRCPIGKW